MKTLEKLMHDVRATGYLVMSGPCNWFDIVDLLDPIYGLENLSIHDIHRVQKEIKRLRVDQKQKETEVKE